MFRVGDALHARSGRHSAARRGLSAAALSLLLAGMAGCGTGGVPLISAPKVEHQPASCVLADVSGSTINARSAYQQRFDALARRVAGQNGLICLVMASGNPLAESAAHVADLTPADPHNSLLVRGEINDIVAQVDTQFAYLLKHPGVAARGTALVEAAVVADRSLQPGGTLEFLSDSVQLSPVLDVHRADLSPTGIQTILAGLDQQRLLPDLTGIDVAFPLPFFHPPRPGDERRPPSATDTVLRQQIEDFWRAWAVRVNARSF
jgi:hypothetical protein